IRWSSGSYKDWIAAVEFREEALQIRDLGQIIDRDVWVGGVSSEEVLVIALRGIEAFAGLNRSRQRGVKDPRTVQLSNISLSYLGLLGISREDRRAVLRANVGTLAIELGGVIGNREVGL